MEKTLDYAYSIGATLLAYLLGSLSFAVIVSKLMGLSDPRSYGSKNPGATNVLRSGSKPAAVATLLLDGLKGWLPVVLVKWFGADYGLGDGTVARRRLRGLPRAFVPGVLPVQGRQGRGDGGGRAAGRELDPGPGDAGHLGDHRLLLAVPRWPRWCPRPSHPFITFFGDREAWYVDQVILVVMVAISALLVYRHRVRTSASWSRGRSPCWAAAKGGRS